MVAELVQTWGAAQHSRRRGAILVARGGGDAGGDSGHTGWRISGGIVPR